MLRSEITIDLDAVRHNARRLLEVLDGAELWAVVKADGYGHGAVDVAAAALNAGASALCVATVAEGLSLRRTLAAARIVVLGPTAEVDAVGPERFAFEDLVRLLRSAVGSRSRIGHATPAVALALIRIGGLFVRDVVLTRDELESLMAGLLVSREQPLGRERLTAWLEENAATVGQAYASELARNFGAPV